MVSCLMGDSTALASAIVRCCLNICPELLMAEMAALPAKWPAMTVSTMLYSACSRLLATSGIA